MKTKLFLPSLVALTFLLAALSTGSSLLLMPFVLIGLMLLAGWISVWSASRTLSISAELDQAMVCRGENARLTVHVSHRGLIPIAPVMLEITSAPGMPVQTVHLRDVPGKYQTLSLPFCADHVGVSSPGIRVCIIEDLLGLFQKTSVPVIPPSELLVFPRTFSTDPLVMSPGDPGSEIMSRATEDLSSPTDVRSYQMGDPMKKVHWKLSLRRRELMVRKFDEPVLQEVLILMDCSHPPVWGHPEAEPDIRDALLETAASVFTDQMKTDLLVYLPLHGAHPAELEKSMGLPLIMENLARVDFSDPDRFERVLTFESRRLRKVGFLVVISARLNSMMVDIMIRIHRSGPNIRIYLITYAPEDGHLLPLISRLQQSGIEVNYVKPELNATPSP